MSSIVFCRRSRALLALSAAWVVGFGLSTTVVAQDAKPAAAKPAKSAAKPRAKPAAEQQPAAAAPTTDAHFAAVDKAKEVGAACINGLTDMARVSIDTGHTAISTWQKDAPGQRAFAALNFLNYENQPTAPRAVSFISATPTVGGHCDMNSLRVQPSKLSCDEIAANLAKQTTPAPAPQKIGDMAIYPATTAGQRVVLLPSPAAGCVVISTGSYFGQ